MKRIRSLLCVPAHKPALYEKALGYGADCLMFDLEDSVPPHAKAHALGWLSDFLPTRTAHEASQQIVVRINPYTEDALRLFDAGARLDALVIPKVREGYELRQPDGTDSGIPLIAVIETPQAIVNLRDIVENTAVEACIFGVADFAAGMGVSDRLGDAGDVNCGVFQSNDRFAFAKQKLATYCAAFGKQALDTCFVVKGDGAEDIVRALWQQSRSWGFTGAAAIHPMQVRVGNDIFGPGLDERCWAATVREGHALSAGEVWTDAHGMVVGLPVARQAEAILRNGGTK